MTLWTFKEESFLPHDIYPNVPHSLAPIRIGYTPQVCQGMDVLINLTGTVPSFFEQFKRIVEIVDDTPFARQAGRGRYRFYRERGLELRVHNITR
jgi:DNA polymerase III subunit chi